MKTLLIILVLFITISIYIQPQVKVSKLSEKDAINLLITNLKRDAVYNSWTKMECLQFYTIEKNEKYFIIDIREKHGDGCPGSTITSPRVDTFKILRIKRKILWYNLPKDVFESYHKFLKKRKK